MTKARMAPWVFQDSESDRYALADLGEQVIRANPKLVESMDRSSWASSAESSMDALAFWTGAGATRWSNLIRQRR